MPDDLAYPDGYLYPLFGGALGMCPRCDHPVDDHDVAVPANCIACSQHGGLCSADNELHYMESVWWAA